MIWYDLLCLLLVSCCSFCGFDGEGCLVWIVYLWFALDWLVLLWCGFV